MLTQEDIEIIKLLIANHISSLETRIQRKHPGVENEKAYKEDILNELVVYRNVYEKLKLLR